MTPKLPKRWSYSALSTWEECPARYAYDYVYAIPSPTSPAMERGSLLHKMAEDYMKDPTAPIPFELKKIGKQLNQYKEKNGQPERVWLLNRAWEPTESNADAWVKSIIDLHYLDGRTLIIRDYKSGREYASHRDQLELYGIIGLIRYPEAERADLAADYIDGGFTGCDGSIIRPMLPKLIDKWQGKAIMMMEDRDWIAKPGYACKWCPHAQGKGGPCGESAKAGQ